MKVKKSYRLIKRIFAKYGEFLIKLSSTLIGSYVEIDSEFIEQIFYLIKNFIEYIRHLW